MNSISFPFFVYFWIMPHFTYILYSKSRDRYYVGSSSDPEERLVRHNAGATQSTKSGRPWKIVFTQSHLSKTEALKHEIYLKKMKSRVYIEDLINQSLSK
jgi:putative endonuclease